MHPLIMKFGGTSVGDPEAIRRSAGLVSEQISRHNGIVVVVSALSGVTNLLIDYARLAAHAAADQLETGVLAYYERHARLIEILQFDPDEEKDILQKLDQHTSLFRTILTSVQQSGHLEPALQDAAASLGERMSAPIMAALLKQHGFPAHAIDARHLIVTDENYTQAAVQFEATGQNIKAQICPLLQKGIIPVITGFIGAAPSGQVTTLGRGASDYTSTILGAALQAAEIWNWTDVDGVFNADPRLVPNAKVIPLLSYESMSIFASCGAKVLHPDTIRPISRLGIPVRVRNSFKPDAPGTLIQAKQIATQDLTMAVVCKSDLILVEKEKTSGYREEWFSGYQLVSLDARIQVCYAVSRENWTGLKDVSKADHIRETSNCSLISVIGRRTSVDALMAILNTAGVTILAGRLSSLDECTSVIVRGEDTGRAAQVLYDSLIDKVLNKSIVNAFVTAWSVP
ncbi:MAG: aspartate kinase [Anaerolineaceae bacterium]|nr:aspartate kinase [Anaerolineaceae bacterium]